MEEHETHELDGHLDVLHGDGGAKAHLGVGAGETDDGLEGAGSDGQVLIALLAAHGRVG